MNMETMCNDQPTKNGKMGNNVPPRTNNIKRLFSFSDFCCFFTPGEAQKDLL